MTESFTGQRLRLFVAVKVPAHVRGGVSSAVAPLRGELPGARWTDPAGWHLTLAFLGWVAAERLPPITRAVDLAVAGTPPFRLTLREGAGMFSRRVLWVGLEPSTELERLAHGIRRALADLGFPPEGRPFHAHLTLARSRRDDRLPPGLERRYRGPRLSWHVEQVVLMRSEPAPGGARYSLTHSAPLRA